MHAYPARRASGWTRSAPAKRVAVTGFGVQVSGSPPYNLDMADDGKPQPIVLTITLTPDGNMHFQGPTHDPILCYGLLELAKDGIRRHNTARIVRPAGTLPPEFMKR